MSKTQKAKRAPKKKMDLAPAFAFLHETHMKLAMDPEGVTAKEIKKYKATRQAVVKALTPLLHEIAQLGLMTSFCWDEFDAVAGFGVDYVTSDDKMSFELHSTDVVFVGDRVPNYDLGSGKVEKNDPMSRFQFDKSKPH
jgi:hypothetical protein